MNHDIRTHWAGKETAFGWLVRHATHKSDDCLFWPFYRNGLHGYPYLGCKGRVRRAHRVMCELAHGPAPTPQHQAAHSCGNGKNGCVNPRHVAWKTASENMLDKRKHGTVAKNYWGRRGKITFEDAERIRSLAGSMTQVELGEMFGLGETSIRHILSGKLWKKPHKSAA